ncbi:MAG: CBS domain-containing protein [Aquificae bacterium]|nr:CBS domain-containing protein [Aquificota bacterium]
MLVKDVMKTDIVYISPLAKVRDALNLMREKDMRFLITEKVNPHDTYGIITYTDILKAIVAEEGDIDLLNVYDLYTKPAIFIFGDIDIRYAAKMMIKFKIKRILVVENNQLKGVVTMDSIIEALMESIS